MAEAVSMEPIPFNVSDNYAVHDIIGEGAYGVVVYVQVQDRTNRK